MWNIGKLNGPSVTFQLPTGLFGGSMSPRSAIVIGPDKPEGHLTDFSPIQGRISHCLSRHFTWSAKPSAQPTLEK